MERINRHCICFPCHDESKLQDCTFCFCPLYPCKNEKLGKYLSVPHEGLVWDCSNCTWPHEKERVDKLFEFLKTNWKP